MASEDSAPHAEITDHSIRVEALSQSVRLCGSPNSEWSSSSVVTTAEKFYAFLKGES